MMNPDFPPPLAGLLNPRAYPHDVESVRLVQTHISWVLLAGAFAYKIKRPVRHAFIDQSTLARRQFLCEEEVRLNQRFARELYLEVCAIVTAGSSVALSGDGAVVEYAVKMRRFDSEEGLDRLLTSNRVSLPELEALGVQVADIHAQLPRAGWGDPWGGAAAVLTTVSNNLDELTAAAGTDLHSMNEALRIRVAALAPVINERRAAGSVRECHGDLHSRNVARINHRLVAFDCLEFDPALRWIDVADEVAFLISDVTSRGFPQHAYAFLSAYIARSGDYLMFRLLPVYKAHRALVRAKVALLSAAGSDVVPGEEVEFTRFVAYAREVLAPGRRPKLLLMYGVSGSGKTWLASQMAPALRAIHIRSDVERKRHGTETLRARLYTPEATKSVYRDLLSYAEAVLSGGYDVIVDATFIMRDRRTAFVSLASRLGLDAYLIHCSAPSEVLRQRVEARFHERRDASDADLDVLRQQLSTAEPVLPAGERLIVIEADTTRSTVLADVVRALSC